jgi:hypothetical protein
MPSDERNPIREEDVQGLKYFRQLWPLFERLREVGCGRDKASNRQLFMDQYCGLVLLFMFNPCLRSLRALQQASELKNVQRKLGCGRSSLGSLSEATDVFDPERLREIIGELAAEVQPRQRVAGAHLEQPNGRRRQRGPNALDDCQGGVFEERPRPKPIGLAAPYPLRCRAGRADADRRHPWSQ